METLSLAIIKRNIREHVDLPSATSSGQRAVAHKCAALIWKWRLPLPADLPLRRLLQSFASYTGDGGPEIGIPTFYVEDPVTLLPHWHLGNQSDMQPDAEDDLGEDMLDVQRPRCGGRESMPFLFDTLQLVRLIREYERGWGRRARGGVCVWRCCNQAGRMRGGCHAFSSSQRMRWRRASRGDRVPLLRLWV